ncbi:hypothetical protein B5V89_18530 [Heyndrickxia sporothermodurans]|uniref:DUF1385 domain-containing protein n=1 Tax=Heyndrickxia TaxID=2837504 RepID=UPI000D3C2027|nr:DUF1385 domain-containing protein [Heyndrickxia sporothermodurans]PTY76284.1 hypothetical protein B5V89_18530 [Heyndrickxia sporothermodurans]
MNYGGRAHLNGVTFRSNDVTVTAKRINNTIEVIDNVDFDEYEYIENHGFDFEYFISKIPFIRGVWNFYSSLFTSLKKFLLIICISLIVTFLLSYFSLINLVTKEYSFNVPVELIIPSIVLILTIYIRFTEVSKYHAAEHMVANCYDQGKKLNLLNVQKQSRVHESCGTNLLTFVLTVFIIFLFIPRINDINVLLLLILSYSIAYELFIVENKMLIKFFKPIYIIGYVFQYLFFTSKPKKEHLKVALAAFNRMIKLQNEIDKLIK